MRAATGGRRSARRRGGALAAGVLVALWGAGCAPREADVALSERARAAPAPNLIATADFDAPRADAANDVPVRQAEADALAARAEALRARGAALSGAPVIAPATVDRLAGAVEP